MLETEMFAMAQGAHGTPDVLGSVSYPKILDCFTSLKDFCICKDFKGVYSKSEECFQPKPPALLFA
jgi:hypothetical protein